MQCARHPSETHTGVCASCLSERLTDLLQLQRERFRVPFSQPLPPPSPPSQNTETTTDRISRTQSEVALTAQEKRNNGRSKKIKPVGEKSSFLSRFKQGQGHEQGQWQWQWQGPSKPRTHTDKMRVNSGVGSSKNPSRERKESGEDARKPRTISAWISALLPRRHREKKSHMPAPAPAPAAVNSSTNLSFLSARSSDNDADFASRNEDFHEQFANSRAYEFEGYYSDSDLMKRGGDARSFPRLKRRVEKRESRAASSSTTARVNLFSESEEDESRRASPHVDPPRRGNCTTYFSGVFPSPTPRSKAWVAAGHSKHKHPDCAGSFSPYTDRKLQSAKPRTENSGFAFCPSPRRLFHREISRSPHRGGKLSNFFFSPSRRAI